MTHQSELDLDALSTELLAVVDQTIAANAVLVVASTIGARTAAYGSLNESGPVASTRETRQAYLLTSTDASMVLPTLALPSLRIGCCLEPGRGTEPPSREPLRR